MTATDRIRQFPANPRYWQYMNKPVLLLGGSVEDNLFQIPDLESHLDRLVSVGGNYIRCTMSSRDEGDVWPFEKVDGLYDLTKPGQEYWHRFENLLKLTRERGVVLQIELWDRFDFARDPWQRNPYNPKNNRTYTPEESGLKEEYPRHPSSNENPFFYSVPEEQNNELLLELQKRQVDELLARTLPAPNVLYCMDNETSGSPAWGAFWARYLRQKADQAGVDVYTTEMWDAHDLNAEEHKATFDHPETYQFVDVSQNNHQKGQMHWDNLQAAREYIEAGPTRPMNNVKTYGADTGPFGNDRDALERFWRNVLGGLAAVRFHRPPAGQGLNENAQVHIKSMRMLTDRMEVWNCTPHNDLLADRSDNEAYCLANPGTCYAVYFPTGGAVSVDLSACSTAMTMQWLDIASTQWTESGELTPGQAVKLTAPAEGHWAVLIF